MSQPLGVAMLCDLRLGAGRKRCESVAFEGPRHLDCGPVPFGARCVLLVARPTVEHHQGGDPLGKGQIEGHPPSDKPPTPAFGTPQTSRTAAISATVASCEYSPGSS